LIDFVCAFGGKDERWGSLVDNLHVRTGVKGHGIGSALLRAIARWSLAADPEAGPHFGASSKTQPGTAFTSAKAGP
jgi:GNAT superfamily N-acetyltransferase